MGEQLAGRFMNMIPMRSNTELATRSDLQAMVARLGGEMAELRADINGTLHRELGRLYRWGAGMMVANGVAVVTALVA